MSAPIENTEHGYWCGNISPSRVNIYFHRNKAQISGKSLKTYKKNFKVKKVSQSLSQQSKKKIFQAVDWMYYLSKPKKAFNYKLQQSFIFRLSFFTATLSSPQIHSDIILKRDVLQPFLDRLRKKHNVVNYIWRLEKQENGNTHFHMILDVYINQYALRRLWNYYQNKLQYVDRYRQNQINFHRHGFKPRPELFKHWSLEKQREAYIEGFENGWNNPNSVDIHSLKGVKSTIAYICKYITKDEEKNNFVEIAPIENTDNIPICYGRIWAVSESLSGIKNPCFICHSKTDEELHKVYQSGKAKYFESEYYYIVYIHVAILYKLRCEYLTKTFESYVETSKKPPPPIAYC